MQTNEVGGQDIFTTAPAAPLCPVCDEPAEAEFIDNGFGPYAVQVGPYHCDCGWAEGESDSADGGWIDSYMTEHGHVCPGCGTTFYCYEDCPEDTPNKRCSDCG